MPDTQLKNFRTTFPMYNDMPDEALLGAMRKKYPMYSDMDDSVFMGALEKKFGQDIQQPEVMPVTQPEVPGVSEVTPEVIAPEAPVQDVTPPMPEIAAGPFRIPGEVPYRALRLD